MKTSTLTNKILQVFTVFAFLLIGLGSLKAQKEELSNEESFAIKSYLFENHILEIQQDSGMAKLDLKEVALFSNSTLLYGLTSFPYTLRVICFRYGAQTGVLVWSAIGEKFVADENVLTHYTKNEFERTYKYLKSLVPPTLKETYIVRINNEFKMYIEIVDKRPYAHYEGAKKDYTVWFYVGDTETMGNDSKSRFSSYNYRNIFFTESQLDDLNKEVEEFFKAKSE